MSLQLTYLNTSTWLLHK